MKKTIFTPVLTQKKSLFVLCLLGGLSTFSMEKSNAFSMTSYQINTKVAHTNSHKESSDAIRKEVTIMLAQDKNERIDIKQPFVRNAFYNDEHGLSKLTRLELEKGIRQEVALAMIEVGGAIAKSAELNEEQLTTLIRREVIRVLSPAKKDTGESVLGWVYLGRFKDNRWLGCPLEMGSKMPETGKQYTTSGDVNIRKSFSALQPVTHVLQANTLVKLTNVVKRGSRGHYWGQVSML